MGVPVSPKWAKPATSSAGSSIGWEWRFYMIRVIRKNGKFDYVRKDKLDSLIKQGDVIALA